MCFFKRFREKKNNDFVWYAYADELQAHDECVVKNECAQSFHEQIIRHDGTIVHIVTHKSPLLDDNHAVVGVFGWSMPAPTRKLSISLTSREWSCLTLLAQGDADKMIARKLAISPRTV